MGADPAIHCNYGINAFAQSITVIFIAIGAIITSTTYLQA